MHRLGFCHLAIAYSLTSLRARIKGLNEFNRKNFEPQNHDLRGSLAK